MSKSNVHDHNRIAHHIIDLIALFKPHCSDTETLDELTTLASNFGEWEKAHTLFSKIRAKTLIAESSGRRTYQYSFEEICAKTLYNIADVYPPYSSSVPESFDADSPYWVVPFALMLAKELGIDASKVQDTVLRSPG